MKFNSYIFFLESFGWDGNAMDFQPHSMQEASFLYHTYGSRKGQAYISSLERFSSSIPGLHFQARKRISQLTRGAHDIVESTKKYYQDSLNFQDSLNSSNSTNSINSQNSKAKSKSNLDLILETEMGQVNITKKASHYKSSFNSNQDSELELLKREAVDIGLVIKPIGPLSDPMFNNQLSRMSFMELLNGNIQDYKRVLELSKLHSQDQLIQEMTLESEKDLLEKIRRRLVHLISKAPPSEFVAGKDLRVASFNKPLHS